MCFLELLKKIDNWIVTSASISDECRLITMDQVRIVWIAIQNDKWAKVNFSLMKYNRTECFQLFKPTTQKVCSFNLKKKSCVFHHSMAYCASNTILSICIYVYPIYCRKTRKNRLSTFNYRLKYHFFSVLSMQPYKWDFVYENSFSITILRHAKFLSDIYYSRTVFFSLNSQWLYLECQFFTTFFLLFHLIYFVIPLGSSLTDRILGRPLSGHSFSLCLFWSLFVVPLQISFFRSHVWSFL